MLHSITVASILLQLFITAQASNDVPRLDFEVQRRSAPPKGEANEMVGLVKRDDLVELGIENSDFAYMARLKIGSNEEEVIVTLDTGSSDLWVVSPDVSCNAQPDKKRASSNGVCTSHGTFDSDNSDTYQSNSSAPDFFIAYGDRSEARGEWGYDNVKLGNATVEDLSFAVVDTSSSAEGVLGIGLPGSEVTLQDSQSPYVYSNLPMKMREQGIISKTAYSLYLGHHLSSSGTVLFGAVDHEKYSGRLTTVPIINTMSDYMDSPMRLDVMVSGLSISNGDSLVQVTDNNYPALLDSGSTLSYFPEALLEVMGEALNGKLTTSKLYAVDCVAEEKVNVRFNFSGKDIEVDLSQFLVTSASDQCYLGIMPQNDTFILLGDNFLRSVYVVYDLEDNEISLAPSRNTDREDIEVISSSVPGATKAESYSSTAFETSYHEADPTATVSHDSHRATSSEYMEVSLSGLSIVSQPSSASHRNSRSSSRNGFSATSGASAASDSADAESSSTARSTGSSAGSSAGSSSSASSSARSSSGPRGQGLFALWSLLFLSLSVVTLCLV